MMALCSLPRSNPDNRIRYKRVNGPYTLYMTAGGGNKLPFGNFPRPPAGLGLDRSGEDPKPCVDFRDSLSGFMRELGIYNSSGGRGGVQTRLRNQMKRLFNAHVQLVYKDEHGEASVSSSVADSTAFWWNPKRPDERMLWESKIELGEKFFNEIINHPVPIDLNTLTALKRSSLGLDLYLWLTYRTFPLRSAQRITWKQVYRQFGVDPAKADNRRTVDDFRKVGAARVKEDQDCLEGVELFDGSGRPDLASLDSDHRAVIRADAPR